MYSRLLELIHSAFQKYASNLAFDHPDNGMISYAMMHQKSEHVADFLRSKGLKKGDRIAICAEKSMDFLSSIFASLLCDFPYIPIDSLAPAKRIKTILNDCQPKGFIVEESILGNLTLAALKISQVEAIPDSSLLFVQLHFDGEEISVPEDLAYVLYTSGSTGTPKGVMISHENALSFIEWASVNFEFSENDVFSSVAPFHFDLSIFDVFVAMKHGATVVLLDEKTIRNPLMLAKLIQQKEITTWYSTPTVLMLMQKYGRLQRYNHQSLTKVFYAGEVFPKEQLSYLKKTWSQAAFYNLYGPTETNVCTWLTVPKELPDNFDIANIGTSCSHVCSILNEEGSPENKGELIVGGASVSLGYLNCLELTASSFFVDKAGARWYKTGDWVEKLDTGEFKFIGRIDRMVKRRGYRIELDEIERAISSCPEVLRVAVAAENLNGGAFIKAFVQSHGGALDFSDLKSFMMESLPSYMLPDEWVLVTEMPLTSSQKINYQAL